MKSLNEFIVLAERTMTKKEKSKEDRLKDKYDDSDMKNNMKDQYGEEEGEKVYYATIRKQAMKKEEVEEGVIDAVKKGAKRHAKAVQAKKIKDRKAVPYAALAAEHQPEGEVVSELKNSTLLSYSQKATNQLAFSGDGKKKAQKRAKGIKAATGKLAIRATDPDGSLGFNKNVRNEDYHSGQGEKIQKRTLAWMKKKGQKGAPGLDAMKARQKEHEEKRGVKEEVGCETKKIENKGKKKIDPKKNPAVEEGTSYGLYKGDGKVSIPDYDKKKAALDKKRKKVKEDVTIQDAKGKDFLEIIDIVKPEPMKSPKNTVQWTEEKIARLMKKANEKKRKNALQINKIVGTQ